MEIQEDNRYAGGVTMVTSEDDRVTFAEEKTTGLDILSRNSTYESRNILPLNY